MHPRRSTLLLTTLALLALATAPAMAGPEGGAVVGGAATISGQGTAAVTVNQSSSSAIINWHTFNVGKNESVLFNQPGSSSVALNRVTGGLGPSEILGSITANGRVFVINRDGVLFGPGAVINTAGFLATTNDIKNSDLMAGRYNFSIPGRPDASIVNLGTITAASGGFAALVAPGVRNSGTIGATLGTVALAAGNSFTLDLYGDRLITLAVNDQIATRVIDVATGQPLKSLITNDGKIKANGGRVQLTAAAARTVVDSVINTSGVITANTIGKHKGMIVLGAATGGTKPAGAPRQTIVVSGTLSAAGKKTGTKGGTILVTGEDIKFVGALVDASGRAGGGKVLIGGDWAGGQPDSSLVGNQSAKLENFLIPSAATVSVDSATSIDASAKDRGDGGKVVLWSDLQTTFAGTILARGGAEGGNGGFVEVSGKQLLTFAGTVDTRAPNGAAGTLLLDPENYFVNSTGLPPELDPTASAIAVGTLVANLSLGNVVLSTSSTGQNAGDIFVQSNVAWAGDNSLTLNAHRNIQINDGVTVSNTGAGSLVLRADSAGSGIGTVVFQRELGSKVDFTASTGKVDIFYNPSSYAKPTDFTPAGQGPDRGVLTSSPSQLTAYMLVNNLTNLTDIGSNLAGSYALGRPIDGKTQIIAPIGSVASPFTGVLEGDGHSISNLAIQATGSRDITTGLFASIGAAGVVRNLSLSSITVNANTAVTGPGQFLGTLAGTSSGAITNVSTSGAVNGGAMSGVIAGGLIGQVQGGGSITQSLAMVNVTTGDSVSGGQMSTAGGLVGYNSGTITQSSAVGSTVSTGINTFAGGLVGRNDSTITSSNSSNTVSGVTGEGLKDISSAVGGLAGFNTGTISGSQATGNVSGKSASPTFAIILGGLVGLNNSPGQIINSSSSSTVTGSGQVELGGLVGGNFASISGSFATGPVSTPQASFGQIGGLVGLNVGTIASSHANGPVDGIGSLAVGGLVGDNDSTASIANAFATGAVTSTNPGLDQHFAGGLVGANRGAITGSNASGPVITLGSLALTGGLVGLNVGKVAQSFATGPVSGDATHWVGGLVGDNDIGGTIALSHASGPVTGGAGSYVGGLAGFNGSAITQSHATGSVKGGTNSIVGGLIGVNASSIEQAFAVGPVSGAANSIVGGLVGLNAGAFTLDQQTFVGKIFQAYATGSVTGGTNSFVGGLVGQSAGAIDQTYAIGPVSGGSGSTLGGLLASNRITLPSVFLGNAGFVSFRTPGTVGSSYWDPQATGVSSSAGGSARSTVEFLVALPPGFSPDVWSLQPNFSYPHFGWQPPATLPTDIPAAVFDVPSTALVIDNLVTNFQFASLTTPPVFTMSQGGIALPQFAALPPPGGGQSPGQPGGAQPPGGPLPGGPLPRIVDIPPPGETRFIQDEVVLQIDANVSIEQVQEAVRRLALTLIDSERLAGTTNQTVLRFRITDGRSVRDVIRQLAAIRIIGVMQPNYVFLTGQQPSGDPATPAARGETARQQGDAAQYILQKLRLPDAHRIVRGTNVPIAVIDSEIDASHPDLRGVIAQRYSALGATEQPHAHGTGMAGAIASRQRLIGTAPSARLLAVHAFSTKAAAAESTTFAILKGIDWSVSQGARIINMSFAGPKDPSLGRALKAAYDRGVVLIAAAGNAGPKSPPLYPGADESVIAVTATDVDDKIFAGANRGKYVAVAAPGVDILVPAPDNAYQLTTGTSVAAAEVSGIVALLLERNPRLGPADIRRILTSSARRLGPGLRNDDFGSGLVDPLSALQSAEPRTVTAPPPARR